MTGDGPTVPRPTRTTQREPPTVSGERFLAKPKMNDETEIPASLKRYSRQVRFPEIGVQGQQALSRSTALIIGCGALGSIIAETLCRAGVGNLRIVDRDFLELSNLQRQSLFTEEDVASGLPKAIAAKSRLQSMRTLIC